MQFFDATEGPEIAQRLYKKMVDAVMEEGESVPVASIKTAILLVADSFCEATGMSRTDFARLLIQQGERRDKRKH